MLASYLKIALRALLKNRIYALTNILGLVTGLVAFLLISLYVQYEQSYDKQFAGQNIYRLALNRIYPEYQISYALVPSGYAPVIQEEIPEIESAARIIGFPGFTNTVRYKDNTYRENLIYGADSTFFDIVPFKIVSGSNDLTRINTAILTESIAKKYFGNEDPLGKRFYIDTTSTEVIGIMEDIPDNSHFDIDIITSNIGNFFLQQPNYMGFSNYTYFSVKEGTDISELNGKINKLVEKYVASQIEPTLNVTYEEYVASGNGYDYFSQPIEDIYLEYNLSNEMKYGGNKQYIDILQFIAVFILLIACINYINLATARSTERAKEVGIRKSFGSFRWQLILQFLTESVVLVFISLIVASIGVLVFLPHINSIVGKTLVFNPLTQPIQLLFLLGIGFLIGILAGFYPALSISTKNAVEIMKGKMKSSKVGITLRNTLVAFQFSISLILVCGTFIVYDQIQLLLEKDLGFEKSRTLVIDNLNDQERASVFRDRLKDVAGIVQTALSNSVPGNTFFGIQFQTSVTSEVFTGKGVIVDDHYINTMKIELAGGRSFSENSKDSIHIILNEAAVKAWGIQDPIGHQLSSVFNFPDTSRRIVMTVIGVAKNFNYESLHTEITPLVLMSNEGPQPFANRLSIKFNSGDTQALLSQVEELWNEIMSEDPMEYTFLGDSLDRLYDVEKTSGSLLSYSTILAVIIAAIGLFGLSSYVAFQKRKEIGIRKVLGGSVSGLVLLLSRQFAKPVLIALIIGIPVTIYSISQWLENFSYKTTIDPVNFILGGLILISSALITTLYQSISAAVADPVDTLKEE